MAKRVTVGQIREAYQAKDLATCVDLLYKYIEQNPSIKQQIIEKASNKLAEGLVDYREVALGDAVKFTVKKENNHG